MTTLFQSLPESVKLHHATRAKAERVSGAFEADYPILSLSCDMNEDESAVISWLVHWNVEPKRIADEDSYEISASPKVPDLADVLEAVEEQGLDPEATFDEAEGDEPEVSGSVVPEVYRARYREVSSNGQTCGDWLAEWLVNETHALDGFNVDEFTAILSSNGVDLNTPWGRLPMSGQKGWIGRYRMNGRQVLEKAVAWEGCVMDARGGKHVPPETFLVDLRTKHSKWLAKREKEAKLAESIAV